MRAFSEEMQIVYDTICDLPRPTTAKEVTEAVGFKADGYLRRLMLRGAIRHAGHASSSGSTWRYDLP